MTHRKTLLEYVHHGGDSCLISLQIGAGAGFDSKPAGKEWVSETTLDETIAAYELVGGTAFINLGLPGFEKYIPDLAWKNATEDCGQERITVSTLETPYGRLQWKLHERKRQGTTPVDYPVHFGDCLEPVKWIIEKQFEALPYIPDMVGPLVDKTYPEFPLCIQWSVQPFEMLCLTPPPDAVMFAMSDMDTYRTLCDRILELNLAMCKAVIGAGADFIFLGGPGRELMSPLLYETFMIPDSQQISATVHEAGGLVYSHICSPVQPFLDMGYYGRMGIDLFETLSPPPVGNVISLAEARRGLPETMCTRGNIGLDVLLTGSVHDVEQTTLAVIEATKGYKHIVAASDYLFYDIPLENARAVVETVETYNKGKRTND